MMNNATTEKLHLLRMPGMAEEFNRQLTTPANSDLSFEHRVRSMVDHEITLRDSKRLQVLLRRAMLPQSASVEDIDYRAQRGLDKAEVQSLLTLDSVSYTHLRAHET